jgi:hypothetical protein
MLTYERCCWQIAQKKPRAKKKPTSVASFEEQFAGQDCEFLKNCDVLTLSRHDKKVCCCRSFAVRNSDHWVAQLDSEAKQNMPPGGYPLSEDFLDGWVCLSALEQKQIASIFHVILA